MRYLVSIFAGLLLSGCTINTNFGSYVATKANTEARGNLVQVYSQDEIMRMQTTYLGLVETEYCQESRTGRLPPNTDLNRILRAKVQKLGGNGIVYKGCQNATMFGRCFASVQCEANAYSVDFN